MQSHTIGDVSSQSYDRWNFMPDKRAAKKKWNACVWVILNKKRPRAAVEKRMPVIHSAAEDAAQQAV
jgi:hypothetical protein